MAKKTTKNTSKNKKSSQLFQAKFTKNQKLTLIVAFVLVLGSVGSYITYRSSAATDLYIALPGNGNCDATGELNTATTTYIDNVGGKTNQRVCKLLSSGPTYDPYHWSAQTSGSNNVMKALRQRGFKKMKVCATSRAVNSGAKFTFNTAPEYFTSNFQRSANQFPPQNTYTANTCAIMTLNDNDYHFWVHRESGDVNIHLLSIRGI